MENLDKLKAALREQLGLEVQRCSLLIWPDEAGRNETDTRLHLGLRNPDGNLREVTIAIDSNGQTPVLEYECWKDDYSIDALEARVREWGRPDFWTSGASHRYECFSVDDSDEFQGVVGSKMNSARILCFEGMEPTGVIVEFESGKRLWVGPGLSRTSVFAVLPENWLTFPYKEIPVT
jgi:hypothetical protein